MADPLTGCDTYDILSGIIPTGIVSGSAERKALPHAMRLWSRMDDADAAQVDWRMRAQWLLNEGSYEIQRLNKIIEAKNG